MKKISPLLLAAVMVLSGCKAQYDTNKANSDAVIITSADSVDVASVMDDSSALSENSFDVDEADKSSVTDDSTTKSSEIKLNSDNSISFLDSCYAKKISVYLIEESNGSAKKKLVQSISGNIPKGKIIEFDENDYLESADGEGIFNNINCGYHAKYIQVGFAGEGEKEILSSPVFAEVTIDTDVYEQNLLDFHGSTACGAASGTLLLQTLYPVYGEELYNRMNVIRNYSAISDDFSTGAPNYYMSGTQIINSIGRYAEENGFSNTEFADFSGDEELSDTLIDLISTGRPVVLEVCYISGKIVENFQGYSHWVAINGFRIKNTEIEFRYENTIGCKQTWISGEMLTKANENVEYPNSQYTPDGFVIALKNK